MILLLLAGGISPAGAADDKVSEPRPVSCKKFRGLYSDHRILSALGWTYGAELFNKETGYQLYISPLMEAVLTGDSDKASGLLKKGSDCNIFERVFFHQKKYADPVMESPHYLQTPLMAAALTGNAGMIRLLLGAGADINARHDDYHHTALEQALLGNASEEVIWLLVEAGADRRSISQALIVAADRERPDICLYLLDHGADVNARNGSLQNDQTPLLCALAAGNKPLAELLLFRGADPNLASSHSPERFNQLFELKYIIPDNGGNMHFMANTGSMSSSYYKGNEGMIAEFRSGDRLLDDLTPLQMILSWSGPIHKGENDPAIRAAVPQIVRLLIKSGARIEPGVGSHTPLMWALWLGYLDSADLLLSAGASVMTLDPEGEDPFLHLLRFINGKISYGSKPFSLAEYGIPALIDHMILTRKPADRKVYQAQIITWLSEYSLDPPEHFKPGKEWTRVCTELAAYLKGKSY